MKTGIIKTSHFGSALMRRACTILALAGASACAGAAAGQTPRIERIDYVVADARRSAEFYEQALGFERESETETADPAAAQVDGLPAARTRTVTLRLGGDRLGLVQYLAPADGRPWPADSRSQDHWFQHFSIAVSDMDPAYARLSRYAPQMISRHGPQTLPLSVGPVAAVKFRDPDGHPVELAHFPPGVSRAASHIPASQSPFLGIDHTALGVGDTARSVAFYRDLLGFQVGGELRNQGPEQEGIDDAPGALVRVTSFTPAGDADPSLEFLQYLQPNDGRDTPADSRANDLWAARIEVAVDDLDGLAAKLAAAGVRFVSAGATPLPGPASGKALTVLDPDGHRVLLRQHPAEGGEPAGKPGTAEPPAKDAASSHPAAALTQDGY